MHLERARPSLACAKAAAEASDCVFLQSIVRRIGPSLRKDDDGRVQVSISNSDAVVVKGGDDDDNYHIDDDADDDDDDVLEEYRHLHVYQSDCCRAHDCTGSLEGAPTERLAEVLLDVDTTGDGRADAQMTVRDAYLHHARKLLGDQPGAATGTACASHPHSLTNKVGRMERMLGGAVASANMQP